jgi:hypothetical protein
VLVEQVGTFELPSTESVELEMSSLSDKGCSLELFLLIFAFPPAVVHVCRRLAAYYAVFFHDHVMNRLSVDTLMIPRH